VIVSYSASSTLGDAATVSVGARAYSDPVLARASLDAAKVVEKLASVPPRHRRALMLAEAEKRGPGLAKQVESELSRQLRRGVAADRAVFDALRTAFANRRMNAALDRAAVYAASREGWSALVDSSLGQLSPSDRVAACTAAGATATAGGVTQVIPVYGQIIGGVLSIGSGIAAQALDCGREEREAQARSAALQAAEAQARIQRAQALAQAEEIAARNRRRRQVIVGGAILGTVALAAVILS
jgi:hypothetical protein